MERAGNEDMSDDVERKGLGTPATRADIIEKLVKDGFVKREKKQMHTDRGRNEADYGASRCGEVTRNLPLIGKMPLAMRWKSEPTRLEICKDFPMH